MKRILVPLDPSDHARAATDVACRLAGSLGAEVTGLTVLDLEGIDHAVALPMRADLRRYPPAKAVELARESKAVLEEVQARFNDQCRAHGVASHLVAAGGSPAAEIMDEARFHDLAVMGLRSHFHFATSEEPGDTLEKVVSHSPAPLLLVPEHGELPPPSRAVIAFDGSAPATRALHHFVPLATTWKAEIRLVAAHFGEKEATHLLDCAAGYLESHGLGPVEKVSLPESILSAFTGSLTDWAEVAAIGTSSKSYVEKFLVGSLPRKLIASFDRPIFVHP